MTDFLIIVASIFEAKRRDKAKHQAIESLDSDPERNGLKDGIVSSLARFPLIRSRWKMFEEISDDQHSDVY